MPIDKKGKFLKILCKRCGNAQVVFGKSSTSIKCDSCNKLLIKPNGGKVKVKTLVKEVYS